MTDRLQYLAEQSKIQIQNKYNAKKTVLMNAMIISMKPIIMKHVNVFVEKGNTRGFIQLVHSYFDNIRNIYCEYKKDNYTTKQYCKMIEECCKECFKYLVLDNEYKNLKFIVLKNVENVIQHSNPYNETIKYYKIPFTSKLYSLYVYENITHIYVDLSNDNTVISNETPIIQTTDPLDTECIICNNNKKNAVLDSNCGHSFCYICLNALHNKRCPLCNKSFINIIKLY
jgi:hypothetical protein